MPADQRTAVFEGIARTIPAGRVGRPEHVAEAIHLLATNPSVTGTVLEVAGGAHLATGR